MENGTGRGREDEDEWGHVVREGKWGEGGEAGEKEEKTMKEEADDWENVHGEKAFENCDGD